MFTSNQIILLIGLDPEPHRRMHKTAAYIGWKAQVLIDAIIELDL